MHRSGVSTTPDEAARVLGSSAIRLERPNLLPNEAMPLGNGRLGVAAWSQDGLTVQLNRADTLPHRLSPGQLHLPGLEAMTGAKNYTGLLDLYNGEFTESGNNMTARVYVQPDTDLLVVDVMGADPQQVQTAQLSLWPPRMAHATTNSMQGVLAESWKDDAEPGASGRSFGSLAALRVEGSSVSIKVDGALSVTASFRPDKAGHYRILVGAPHYDGSEAPAEAAAASYKELAPKAHRLWWHAFWQRTGLIEATSGDGWGQYSANLRNIYLFSAAAESSGDYPGSQAGIADLFSAVKDTHQWDPAAFWHWNLRMQVAANLGAGLFEANVPYFRLYRENLASITAWTQQHMQARPGICIPETMRFNGLGIEYEQWDEGKPVVGLNCDATSKPYYNARTISTGAEVATWIWQQYQKTLDRTFLARNYPVMAAAARFLLDYEKPGADGRMHTFPSNAHETQWDVTDPTTDLSARLALFADTADAARLLNRDPSLVRQLTSAQHAVPPFPRTQADTPHSLLPESADAQQEDVLAASYTPAAEQHNVENIGLEPVWPYGLIGADSPLEALAQRTFAHRPYPVNQDWSCDPIDAARLGLGTELAQTMIALTQKYQKYANGMASWGGTSGEFYIEQDAVIATALQEALAQDFDGTIRVARAIPPHWDMAGTVFLRGRNSVRVQVVDGSVEAVALAAGSPGVLRIQNPWPEDEVTIKTGATSRSVKADAAHILSLRVLAGRTYVLARASHPAAAAGRVLLNETSGHARRIGQNVIGLEASKPAQ